MAVREGDDDRRNRRLTSFEMTSPSSNGVLYVFEPCRLHVNQKTVSVRSALYSFAQQQRTGNQRNVFSVE